MLLPEYSAVGDESLSQHVISRMRNDKIAFIGRKDPLIVKLGVAVLDKIGPEKAYYVSQRMRQLAKLVEVLT